MRKTIRNRLVALYEAEGSFNRVHGYAPVDLQSYTKVLCIYNDNTRNDFNTKDYNVDLYAYTLDIYVRRETGINTENVLDDLHEVVRQVARDNVGDSNWNHLELAPESDAYFAEISGLAYRVERYSLTVKIIR